MWLHLAKIQQNSGKICDILEKNSKISASDQGSRIKDQMVVENALDLKEKVPSAPTPGHRGSRP